MRGNFIHSKLFSIVDDATMLDICIVPLQCLIRFFKYVSHLRILETSMSVKQCKVLQQVSHSCWIGQFSSTQNPTTHERWGSGKFSTLTVVGTNYSSCHCRFLHNPINSKNVNSLEFSHHCDLQNAGHFRHKICLSRVAGFSQI